jgi:hypothetical protein
LDLVRINGLRIFSNGNSTIIGPTPPLDPPITGGEPLDEEAETEKLLKLIGNLIIKFAIVAALSILHTQQLVQDSICKLHG